MIRNADHFAQPRNLLSAGSAHTLAHAVITQVRRAEIQPNPIPTMG